MTSISRLRLLVSTLALASLACATDPNLATERAEAAHDKDVLETDAAAIDQNADHVGDHAALNSDHNKDHDKLNKQVADDANKYEARRSDAAANTVEARRIHRADSSAQWSKLDTRTTALETKCAEKKILEPGLAALRTRLTSAKASMAGLIQTSDAAWFESKQHLDAELDSLEGEIKKIEART